MIVLCKAYWACLFLWLLTEGLHGALLSKEDKEYLEKIFLKSQDAIASPKLRNRFLAQCALPNNQVCPRAAFTSYKIAKNFFKPGVSELEKLRFYQIYLCFKFKQVKECPVDGGWGAWNAWSKCPVKCGLEGKQSRYRLCSNPKPLRYGWLCPGPSIDYKGCITNCKKRAKGRKEAETYFRYINEAFPKLKQECGSGHCTYDDVSHYLNGKELEKYWASLQCIFNNRDCPVDGGWTSWTSWTACQPVCGSGYRQRERFCQKPSPRNGGYQCIGPSYQNHHCFGRKCNKADMVFGHYFSDWSDFSPCSASCGNYGVQSKRRICLIRNKCQKQLLGNNTNALHIFRPCFNGECPAKGGWSSWQVIDFCSARCGIGRKLQFRLCNFPYPTGSASCIGNEVETSICRGSCDETWDMEVKKFKKLALQIKSAPTVGDTPAKGDRFGNPLIKALEQNYTDWSQWTSCSKSCEGGFRWRERACKTEGKCLGEIFQRQLCNTAKCPVQGGWSNWLEWSVCSVTCGQGVETRYRKCDNPYPRGGGTCPEFPSEERKCNMKPCKNAYLRFGEWESWSNCSQPCGQKGTRFRVRKCIILPRKKSKGTIDSHPFIGKMAAPKSAPVQKTIRKEQHRKQVIPTGGSSVKHTVSQKNNNAKHGKHNNEIPYEKYLKTKYEAEKLAKQQDKLRETLREILPKPKRGKTRHHRNVPRNQHNSRGNLVKPNNPNLPKGARVLKVCSAHGTQIRSRCNVKNCPVDGKWANWGSWTKCSKTCEQGVHVRERTCTDPFPNGGKNCVGSGTETAPCFKKPCPDPEDKGIGFKGKGFLSYKNHNKATPFLVLYILFKPLNDDGVLIHRFRKCDDTKCAHEVLLTLEKGTPWLQVSDGKFQLQIKYPNKLKKKIWHNILVSIFRSHAFMRVDDGKHQNKTVKFSGELNFDATMTVGWDKHRTKENGFVGQIASLRVNFRAFSLFKDTSQAEYGSPFKRVGVNQVQLEPTVAYPIFQGNNYMKLSVVGTTRFSVDVIFSASRLSGLLLFNAGNEENSYLLIKMKKAVLTFCFNCGKKRVCTDLAIIQPNAWYYISLVVKKITAKIRLNNGPSIELNSNGPCYSAGRTLFIGGGEIEDKYQLDKGAKTHAGFVGYIYRLKINGQRVDMKGAAIMNVKGFLNSMGMTYTASDVIKESERSDVMLKCDYAYYARKTEDVDIMWFEGDRLVHENKTKRIHDKLRGQPFTSGLQLVGDGHQGIYLCAVHHAGVMVVQHAFIVEEPVPVKVWNMAAKEEVGVRIVAAVLPVVFIICLILVCRYRADLIGKQKVAKVMSKLQTIEQIRKSELHIAQNKENIAAANMNEYVDESNLNTPRDEDTSNFNTPRDEDTSNVNTPRDDEEDTSNLNTPRDEDTSNVTTPRDRDASHYKTPPHHVEENYYDTIEDLNDYIYMKPYSGDRNTMHDKQVFFQEMGNEYEVPQGYKMPQGYEIPLRYEMPQGYEMPQEYVDEFPEKDEELKENIDGALDVILGKSSRGSLSKKQKGSSRRRSKEGGVSQQRPMEGYTNDRSEDIPRPTYFDTLRSRHKADMQDRSVHAAYVTDSKGNVYETRGTSVGGLPPMHSREGERIFSNDVIDQGYLTRGNDFALYDIDMGQSPSHRFQCGTDSRSSVAQRTVLPNVASMCGNQGGIIMTDDVEPEYVNDHQRTPQREPYSEHEDVHTSYRQPEDPPMIFKTRIVVGNPNIQSTPKDDKARLSFIAPHSYSDHRNIKIDKPVDGAQKDVTDEEMISGRDRNFVVPEAPPPPVGVSPIPPAPPPPPMAPPAPPIPQNSKKK